MARGVGGEMWRKRDLPVDDAVSVTKCQREVQLVQERLRSRGGGQGGRLARYDRWFLLQLISVHSVAN
jgi:hypothetical protein